MRRTTTMMDRGGSGATSRQSWKTRPSRPRHDVQLRILLVTFLAATTMCSSSGGGVAAFSLSVPPALQRQQAPLLWKYFDQESSSKRKFTALSKTTISTTRMSSTSSSSSGSSRTTTTEPSVLDDDDDKSNPMLDETHGVGLYHAFCQHALVKLANLEGLNPVPVEPDLARRTVPAKGGDSMLVRIQSRAFSLATTTTTTKSSTTDNDDDDKSKSTVPPPAHGIRYARYSLLETINTTLAKEQGEENDKPIVIHETGIQVLNLVLFPVNPLLPVWGADFVSLPGNKHLVLLDAQPMVRIDNQNGNDTTENATLAVIPHANHAHDAHFQDWYETHVVNQFAWGGDFPSAIARYVSDTALWSRLTDDHVVATIQTRLYQAFGQHVDLYLDYIRTRDMVQEPKQDSLTTKSKVEQSQLPEYLQYRLENDPARPMLKSLFGEEWTERLLEQVLFPSLEA